MRTIQLKLNESDLLKYNIEAQNEINFVDLVEKLSLYFARKALLECNEIAEKTGLSNLTEQEINDEIKAVRNAKGNY